MKIYPPIIDTPSVVQLRKDVEYFNSPRNHWIGIHDEPENTIEKYIQDSYDSVSYTHLTLPTTPYV